MLPILHGERLIGRVDPLYDRKSGVLRVQAVYAEPDASEEAGPAVRTAIEELARWLGASEVDYGSVAGVWRGALA